MHYNIESENSGSISARRGVGVTKFLNLRWPATIQVSAFRSGDGTDVSINSQNSWFGQFHAWWQLRSQVHRLEKHIQPKDAAAK